MRSMLPDPRLFDEMMDWLSMNWELVNISRINFMLKKHQWQGIGALGALSSWMMKNMGKKTKWASLTGTDSRHDDLASFFLDRNGAEIDIIPELVAGIRNFIGTE